MNLSKALGMSRKDWIIGVVSPLLAALAGASLTLFGAIHYVNVRDESLRAASLFRNESTTFEAVTANYVRHMLDDEKPDPAATEQLSSNLFSQQRAMEGVTKLLPKEDTRLAAEYRAQLSALLATLPKTKSVTTMKDFWEQVSKTLVLRNEVLKKLPS